MTDSATERIAAVIQVLSESVRAFLRAPSAGSGGPGSVTIVVQDFNIRAAHEAIAKADEFLAGGGMKEIVPAEHVTAISDLIDYCYDNVPYFGSTRSKAEFSPDTDTADLGKRACDALTFLQSITTKEKA